MGALVASAALLILCCASLALGDDVPTVSEVMAGLPGMGCGGHEGMGIGFFEPGPLGGLMIRGRPVFLLRSVPVVTRITFSSDEVAVEEGTGEEGLPFPHLPVGPYAMARRVSRLLALGRQMPWPEQGMVDPEDMVDLDSNGQDPRISAFQEMQEKRLSDLTTELDGAESGGIPRPQIAIALHPHSPLVTRAQIGVAGGDNSVTSATVAEGRSLASIEALQSKEGVVVANDVREVKLDAPFVWTPSSVCGLVLLTFSFGLLLAMLLMSLSSLIYGCSGDPTESVVEIDAQDEAPLLKFLEAAGLEVVKEVEVGGGNKEKFNAQEKA